MRRRISYTAIFSVLCLQVLLSQDIQQAKRFADEQLLLGNDRIALKEYQRVLLFDREGAYREIFLTIASLYDAREETDRALAYYDMAWNAMQGDSIRREITFRKTLCHFTQEQYLLALGELYSLPDSMSADHMKRRQLYLGIAQFGLEDLDASLESFATILDTAGTAAVKAELAVYDKYREKYDPDRLQTMSIFLPGLGQIYGGKPASGINSIMLLAAISTYSYFTIINYSLLDGLLVFTSWFYRYYTGGHRNAYEIGLRRLQEKKQQTYQSLLRIIRKSL